MKKIYFITIVILLWVSSGMILIYNESLIQADIYLILRWVNLLGYFILICIRKEIMDCLPEDDKPKPWMKRLYIAFLFIFILLCLIVHTHL